MSAPHDLITWRRPKPGHYCAKELSVNTSLGGGKPHPNHRSGYGWLEVKQDKLSAKHWENWDGGGVEGCAEQGRGWFSSSPNRCCKTDPHNELPCTELLAGFPFCCRDEIPEESTLGEKRVHSVLQFRAKPVIVREVSTVRAWSGKKWMHASSLFVCLCPAWLLHCYTDPHLQAEGMALLRLQGVFLHQLTRLRSSPQMWLQANSV